MPGIPVYLQHYASDYKTTPTDLQFNSPSYNFTKTNLNYAMKKFEFF